MYTNTSFPILGGLWYNQFIVKVTPGARLGTIHRRVKATMPEHERPRGNISDFHFPEPSITVKGSLKRNWEKCSTPICNLSPVYWQRDVLSHRTTSLLRLLPSFC